MAQLRQDYKKFSEANAEVIAVGPEEAPEFTKWWREHEMPFIGIADPGHTIAGFYSQQTKIFKGGRMPAQAVIDKQGKIRFMHYGASMSDIPSNEEILAIVEKLNKEHVNNPELSQKDTTG